MNLKFIYCLRLCAQLVSFRHWVAYGLSVYRYCELVVFLLRWFKFMLIDRIKVVIFGAGGSGKNAYNKLYTRYDILAFVDNKWTDLSSPVHGVPLIPPQQLDEFNWEKILIASEYFEVIQDQLIKGMGVDFESIEILPARLIKPNLFGKCQAKKAIAESILFYIAGALQEANIPYFVDAGTLLGIYRDNELIPWDDDLDFSIESTSQEVVYELLSRSIEGLEALTGEAWGVVKHYAERGFGAVKAGDVRGLKLTPHDVCSKLPLVDLFVRYVEGDTMDYVLASRGLTMPSEHFLKLGQYKFRNKMLCIPGGVETYLTRHYGDWKTPVKDWNLGMLKNSTILG